MNSSFIFLIFLVLTLSVVKAGPTKNPLIRNEGKTTYKIRLTKAICVDLPYEIAWNVTCRLKLYRDQPSKMLFRVEVDQVDHLFLTFAMYYKYHLTYQPLLMETTFDVCSYLDKFKSRGYASVSPSLDLDQTAMFILSILEKNNPQAIRSGCPYRGVIAFENFRIDETMAPQFCLPASIDWICGTSTKRIKPSCIRRFSGRFEPSELWICRWAKLGQIQQYTGVSAINESCLSKAKNFKD